MFTAAMHTHRKAVVAAARGKNHLLRDAVVSPSTGRTALSLSPCLSLSPSLTIHAPASAPHPSVVSFSLFMDREVSRALINALPERPNIPF